MTHLRDKKCLVLGAGGFLGVNLCSELIKYSQHVTALSRSFYHWPHSLSSISKIEGSMSLEQNWASLIQNVDLIFHLVGGTTPATGNLNLANDINQAVLPTLSLLNACSQSGNKCRIIFVSSGGAIYGPQNTSPLSESAPTNPISGYGIMKLTIEKYLALFENLYHLDYRILRVSNPFGPHQQGKGSHGVVASFMRRLLKNEPVDIWGSGDTIRDYIYVEDVSKALCCAALHQGPERIFNIGGGCGRTLLEVLRSIERVLEKNAELRWHEARKFDVPCNILNIELAKSKLNWLPKMGFEEGLRLTYQWLQEDSSKLTP